MKEGRKVEKKRATDKIGRWRGRPWVMLALDAVALAVSVVVAYEIRIGLLTHWRHGIQEGEFLNYLITSPRADS
jgi:hypothetical protein